MRRMGIVLIGAAILASGGCAHMATQKGHLVGIEPKLKAHDVAGALEQIQAAKARAYKNKDRILYYLDAGILFHYNGRWAESNDLLTQAERAIEEAYTRSISSAAASMLLNDNTLEYPGEDYEDLYLNVFKALNYLRLGQFDSAFVEVRRINDKLNLLEDKYARIADEYNRSKDKSRDFKPGRIEFHQSALARYISMLMYRAEGKRDDARIDLDKISEAWRSATGVYDFAMPPLATALTGSPAEYAKLNVLCFYGRSPDKLAKTLYIYPQPTFLTIMTTRQEGPKQSKLNTLEVIPWNIGKLLPAGSSMKFQLPYMKFRDTQVSRAVLYLNGYPVCDLAPIERMDKVAFETFKIKEPMIYLKTITRSVSKTIVKTQAMKELKKHKDGQYIPTFLVDLAVAATENADLRIAQFFPAVAAVGEVEVPVGQHRATVVYFDRTGTRLHQDDLGAVTVAAGGLNLLHSAYLN